MADVMLSLFVMALFIPMLFLIAMVISILLNALTLFLVFTNSIGMKKPIMVFLTIFAILFVIVIILLWMTHMLVLYSMIILLCSLMSALISMIVFLIIPTRNRFYIISNIIFIIRYIFLIFLTSLILFAIERLPW